MFIKSKQSRIHHGFTLIEMLVVIAIIAILAGISTVAYSAALHAAQNAQAKTDLIKIVNATTLYYTDNGQYPLPANLQGQDVTFGEDVPYTSQLMDVLRADYQGWDAPGVGNLNPKQIVYVDWRQDFVPHAKNGIGQDGQPYDPWGRVYIVRIDSNYDNVVANPYSTNAGSDPLQEQVIAWSFGKDSQGGEGDKNAGTSKDDVISW